MPDGLCLSVCGTWYYCYLLGFVFLLFFFLSYFASIFWQSRLEGIQAGQKHFTLAADCTITDNMPTEGIHSHKIIHHSKTDPNRWLLLPSVAWYHQFKTFPVSVSLGLKSKSFALCLCIKCCLSCYVQPMTCCHLFFLIKYCHIPPAPPPWPCSSPDGRAWQFLQGTIHAQEERKGDASRSLLPTMGLQLTEHITRHPGYCKCNQMKGRWGVHLQLQGATPSTWISLSPI